MRIPNRRPLIGYLSAATILIGVVVLGACGGQEQAQGGNTEQSAASVDWDAVGQAMGKELEDKGEGVHGVEFPRSDLTVSSEGVTLDPGMELAAEANFKDTDDGKALVLGEMTLTEEELQPVIDKLQQGGIEQTALHKHLQDESPRLWWFHFRGYGDPVQTAQALRSALESTDTPLDESSEEESESLDLDTDQLDQIIGQKGETESGVYQYRVPREESIMDTAAGTTLSAEMEGGSLLMFQPTGNGMAAINGDFAMTDQEINPVIQALRENGIEALPLHSHLIYEEPTLYYMHVWANDDAAKLARGLRAALDETKSTTENEG
jgi:Domain of Unknown Function (DUF1259)